jgi:uncharacterized protein (DUF1015 family)
MAEIRPFRALRYNPEMTGDLGRVVTQPYDKISPEMQARYYALSPYNLVRIVRGREHPTDTAQGNVYTRAGRYLREWREQGALVQDPAPAIYPYAQEYAIPGEPGVVRQRRGFIALGRLEDYAAGVVHRHEETLSGPKADRLELLKVTRAHFGQIFMLYSDPAAEIEHTVEQAVAGQPPQDVADEYGSRHSLRRLSDRAALEWLVDAMRGKQLVIADGHHRYETALAYRDICRAQGRNDERAEYVMMTFIRKECPGLTILPTHRVVHSLPTFNWNAFVTSAARLFGCQMVDALEARGRGAARLVKQLSRAGHGTSAFAAYAGPGKLALIGLRRDTDLGALLPDVPEGLRRLDVVILHHLLLEQVLAIDPQAVREEKNLRYVRESEDALRQVESGQAQIAFLMNPTPIASVWDNALAGRPLPQKSTDFYPKLLSGLTMYWLDSPGEK